jgi:CheY-like chemotaxis protein
MNVLVADDDGVTRLLLSSALSKLGHSVHEAENGRDALAFWEQEHQHLVISDWMMPDIDGLEFCREIRAKRGSDLTYIILLTARAGKANYLQAMEAGADDFITKPFEKDQLASRVRVAERILQLHENLSTANSELERRVLKRTAELENALAVKNEFLSRASHELRTPMNHILGFAQLLKMEALTPRQRTSVEQILTSGSQLLRLIDRVLAVAKARPNDLSFPDATTRQIGLEDMAVATEDRADPTPLLNQLY